MAKGNQTGKKVIITIGLILVGSLIFHLVILANSRLTFYSDDAIYAILAKAWIEKDWGRLFHPAWPPLYPALSALGYLITGNWELALRLVSTLAGVGLILPLYFLAKQSLTWGQTVGFLIVVSLVVPLLNISVFSLSDALATFLIISFLVTILAAMKRQRGWLWLLGGIWAGFIYLTRAEGTLFFGLTGIYLCVYFGVQIFEGKKKLLNRAVMMVIFAAAFLLAVSPYAIAIKRQLGRWTLSQKFSAQIQQRHIFALNDEGTTWAQDVDSAKFPNYKSTYFRGGTAYLLDHINYFEKGFWEKLPLWEKIFLQYFPVWSLPLMAIGVLNLLRKGQFWGTGYLVFITAAAIPITIFVTALADVRYLIWTLPLFVWWFYLGTNIILTFLRKISWFKSSKVVGFLIAVIPGIACTFLPIWSWQIVLHPVAVYARDFTNNHYWPDLEEAAGWIKSHSKQERLRIMMRYENGEFYADGETIYLPQASYERVLDYARKQKVDFIVATSNELEGDENLSGLLDKKIDHPGLKEVYAVTGRKLRVVVYVLEGDN